MVKTLIGSLLIGAVRLLARLLMRLHIQGLEHFPQDEGVMIISNHFSWFEPPLLMVLLPRRTYFMVATESQENPLLRWFVQIYDLIPVWRGQVDRKAMGLAVDHLARGHNVGIFPEGGVNPELAQRIARGEQIPEASGNLVRSKAELISARPGTAFLAVQSGARLLPVAFSGTENLLVNLRRLHRTEVTMCIGPLFGPLTLDRQLRGPGRRQQLDQLSHDLMLHIAALLPPAQRGPYSHFTTPSR